MVYNATTIAWTEFDLSDFIPPNAVVANLMGWNWREEIELGLAWDSSGLYHLHFMMSEGSTNLILEGFHSTYACIYKLNPDDPQTLYIYASGSDDDCLDLMGYELDI